MGVPGDRSGPGSCQKRTSSFTGSGSARQQDPKSTRCSGRRWLPCDLLSAPGLSSGPETATSPLAEFYACDVAKNPAAIPADTSPEVWRRQMTSLAQRTSADLLAEWEALNAALGDLEANGVRRRHPAYSEREVFLSIVRRRYGDVLYQAAWPGEPLLEP